MTRRFALAALTAIDLTPPQLVSAAARSGYDAVGLRLNPFRAGELQHPMFNNSPMLRETEARLHDTGLWVLDIEVMRLSAGQDVQALLPVLETGHRLGAKYALTLIDIADLSLAAAKFAELCALAAPLGITCVLEFAVWLGVGSIQAASVVIQQARRVNGALLLDPFHLFRSGGQVADISAVNPHLIHYAQFCDASATAPVTTAAISDEARFDRCLPGEGGLPLPAFVAALPQDVPLSLEVPNRQLAATVGLDERLRRTLAAARKIIHG
ncbi:sugar phosphate isomerase/epimerase family protein [Caballeronia sordidicola]|jgi:sugar phosphate isomerase/epimerase|uniref:Xylose isomerase domain protein TIM barrel n=1 Tax=Caballeronia sordidicola TaxID=196367 RepID=A0A226X1M4_CABSO|nr:sugar phosphate isomerase/epimerase [Caballeronia sordidicola]OXC77345.1 Xylose isomerase domain protein TIM barrel [Caballeronia sordidicola]